MITEDFVILYRLDHLDIRFLKWKQLGSRAVSHEFDRNSHLKKTQLVTNSFFMPIWAKNNLFVKYGVLEYISMRERGKKIKILNFTH